MPLVAQQIEVRHGRTTLLHGVSITVTPGTLMAIIGPNGAGKSTLLSCLSGLKPPSAGEISLNGQPLRQWPIRALARARVMLAQQSALSFPLTVKEVVMLGRSPYPADHRQDNQAVAAAMRVFDIDSLAERRYPTLSGGEQQRVQLARSWAQLAGDTNSAERPGVLLLDEPLAALDLSHQLQVMNTLHDVSRTRQLAVVIVLHDISLAARYADKVICLKQGKQVAEGAPASVLTAECIQSVYGVQAAFFEAPDRGKAGVFLPHPPG